MKRIRGRVSIAQEDRIWNLRCQGYDYDSIARITNIAPGSPCKIIKRVRRRPPFEKDPIKRGRARGFLNDLQILQIRQRYMNGEKQHKIAKDFDLTSRSVSKICTQVTYKQPCEDQTLKTGYPYRFGNRLVN